MTTVAAIGVAGTIAAGCSVPVLAGTTSGVRYAVVQTMAALGPNGTECSAYLLSAAASDGSPAYASAMVMNTLPETCTGWLEHSVNGGAWTDVSPRQNLPGGQGINNPAWYKSANYYAGPGTRIRACIEVQIPAGGKPTCGKSASLAASIARPASDATAVYYAQRHHPAEVSPGGGNQCWAYLSSSTRSKASTSQVNLTFWEWGAVLACTGWLESSTDNGKTWEQATPTYSNTRTSLWQYAFSSAIADGTGKLARACVRDSAATACTPAW